MITILKCGNFCFIWTIFLSLCFCQTFWIQRWAVDLLPSSSSAVSSSVRGYKAPHYLENPHAPSQDLYDRVHPKYPPTAPFRPNKPPLYPIYPNARGAGQHMAQHPAMPSPPLAPQADREWDSDSGGIVSRRWSYQEANSSSKYSHHPHHSERERGKGLQMSQHGLQRPRQTP